MDSKKKELIKRLNVQAREFRFCGPSDDLAEQAAVTAGYHYLVVQFKNLEQMRMTERSHHVTFEYRRRSR